MANKNFIDNAGLNFYDVKYNFINYLKNQSEFSDYNLEGSNLTILLDILAYNTSQQGFYNTMVANEMFIDRANKRSSIVSLAKLMGYTPSTKRAAKATVLVTVDAENIPSSRAIQKGSVFSGSINNTTYSFTNLESYGFYPNTFDENGNPLTYACGPISLHQGILNTISYNVESYEQPFLIPDDNADKDSVKVYVMNSVTDVTGLNIPWFANTDFVSLDEESTVFFVEENNIGQLTIRFGDGVIGRKLNIGNVVVIEYLSTSGSDANGVGANDTLTRSSFTVEGNTDYTVLTIEPSNSGFGRESSSSIRRNAIRNYTTKERAVTLKDYEGIVLGNFNDNAAVRCWGGEDNDPPFYGKVFVSIRPIGSTVLSKEEKNNLVNNVLRQKNIVGMDVIVVDPEVLYINPSIEVYYDKTITNESESSINKKIKDGLAIYLRKNLVEFGDSIFSNDIENTIKSLNNSIKSVEAKFIIERRVVPTINIAERTTIDFQNELYHPFSGHNTILTSDRFLISSNSSEHFVEDDGNGKLILKSIKNGVVSLVNSNYGTIDYSTGKIVIPSFKVYSIPSGNTYIRFKVQPISNNLFSKRNTILQYDSTDNSALTIKLIQVKTQQVIGGSGSVIAKPNNY